MIHQNIKSNFLAEQTSYWCWSRRDIDEGIIKNTTLSTALVDDNEFKELIMEPFSVRYLSNKTHYKCDYDAKWTAIWYPLNVDNISPCMANTALPVNVKFRATNSNL